MPLQGSEGFIPLTWERPRGYQGEATGKQIWAPPLAVGRGDLRKDEGLTGAAAQTLGPHNGALGRYSYTCSF